MRRGQEEPRAGGGIMLLYHAPDLPELFHEIDFVWSRPAVSMITTSAPATRPRARRRRRRPAGSAPCFCCISDAPARSPDAICSFAAARNVSEAAIITLCPVRTYWWREFADRRVFPTPLLPTTMITQGLAAGSANGSGGSVACAGQTAGRSPLQQREKKQP